MYSGGAQLLKHLHQEGIPISKFLRKRSIDQVIGFNPLTASPRIITEFSYRSIPLGDLIVSSSVRILLSMGPEWDNPVYRTLVDDLFSTAVDLVDAFYAILEDYQPDRVVLSHAIYLSWGIAFRVARQLNIPVLVYNGSYRRNTLRMYLNAPNAPFPEAAWPQFQRVELKSNELQWTNDYLKGRFELKDESHDLFGSGTTSTPLQVFIEKAKREGKKLAALFTNMSWDAYSFSGEGIFDSMTAWANETLEFARAHPDLYLIFKIHPGEVYWKVPEKYKIRHHLTSLPENVFLLTETDRIKPTTFYPYLDFGLINISTVAIEMAYLGLPVLTSGAGGHYDGRGFTLSPASRQEYFDHLALLTAGDHDFVPDGTQLRRYVFYRFYREAIPFEPLDMQGYDIQDVRIDSYDDLRPGLCPGMDTLAESILAAETAVWKQPAHSDQV
jgi:hypothetical protein